MMPPVWWTPRTGADGDAVRARSAGDSASRPWHQARFAQPLLRWLRWAGGPNLTGSGFESARYLTRWLLLGTAIGAVAGLGAIVFYLAIDWSTHFFLGELVGYLPPSPVGEGAPVVRPIQRPWLLPLVVALGGLLSGLIVFNLAPEAEGHGTDAAIAALHHRQGRVRARIPPIKLLASAITIGAGGSGGREGPAAQISAGFGSLLGQWLRLKPLDRRIAVAAGMGAGIGAIFRAPLGGALMGAEILYLHDLEVEAIIPALIASIVGYTIYGAYFGFSPIFGAQPELALDAPIQLVYYAALGVLAGLGGILYARVFYGLTGAFHHLHLPAWLKPALGGLLVGSMALVVPGALHMGYGWVQISMGPGLLDLPLWMVVLLPFAKIVSTSLSIGSGGSGGIFGPGMVIGGMLGATLWRLGYGVLPNMPDTPAPFVIVGMMALFGGIAHAPLAVMLMVAEMTGNLSMLAPAMVAVGVSTALVGDTTIYRSQLPNRASAPAHRLQFSFPLLSALQVRDAMTPPRATISTDASVGDALALLQEQGAASLAVLDGRNRFTGLVTRDALRRVEQRNGAPALVGALASPALEPLSPADTLDTALEDLAEHGLPWLPVVAEGRVVGGLSARDALRTYKATLGRSVRRTQGLPEQTSVFEVKLRTGSPLIHRTLREAGLPKQTLVIAIVRDMETLFPTASTELLPDDVLMVMASAAVEEQLKAFLEPVGTGTG
jgi:chloride channel protein, CIC family